MGLTKAHIKASDAGVDFDVQFNPKELQVDKSVSWTAKNTHSEDPEYEFKEPQSASLSVTLYFDGYESKTSVGYEGTASGGNKTISSLTAGVLGNGSSKGLDGPVRKLQKTARMTDKGHPPMTTFSWGDFVFEGVVENVSVKYTMFLENGTPCRAEVTLKMKSASGAKVGAKSKKGE